VVIAARRAEALEVIRAHIVADGGAAQAIVTDATDAQAVNALIATTQSQYGRIDGLVNAVGSNIKRRAVDELTTDSWNDMVATNLTAAFYLTHAVVPVFRTQGGGILIHISSVAGRRPDRSGIAYQATKAGVAALAHGTMEEEREHGLRVTVIYPGLTDTPLVQQRPTPPTPEMLARALQPEDIAAACLFVLEMPPRAYVPELVLTPSRS
jgi:NADP-dependent 3-hydroxy acid dehydrogenase YdfG